MCSPIGDGAAAVVVLTRSAHGGWARTGCGCAASRAHVRAAIARRTSPRRSAARRGEAYEIAGVGPDDLDVIEVHDAAAPAELMAYEELGLCAAGEGPKLLRSGRHAPRRASSVVNPSGGLLSKGHPIGATGCAQIVELADQLRGRCGLGRSRAPGSAWPRTAAASSASTTPPLPSPS